MAYLSAGHVPGEGPYAGVIDKGVRWVLAQQTPAGVIGNQQGMEMYHHGISTLMLAEVCGMTDAKLESILQASFAWTAKAWDASARAGGLDGTVYEDDCEHADTQFYPRNKFCA